MRIARRPVAWREYRCAVVINGERCCNGHREPIYTREEANDMSSVGYICPPCLDAGFIWLRELIDDINEDPLFHRNIVLAPAGYNTNVKEEDPGVKTRKIKNYSLWMETPAYKDAIYIHHERLVDPHDIKKGLKPRPV